MNFGRILKIRPRHLFLLPRLLYQYFRVGFYRLLSDAEIVVTGAKRKQPVLATGKGKIFLRQCNLGVWPSPFFFNGYIHLEARCPGSEIIIEDGVYINNNACIVADRTSIHIGANTLIGPEFTVFDSDFHDLHQDRRTSGTYDCIPVIIGENVFIGSRVTILKGVSVGKNSVVAAGSVLGVSVPENSIVGGVPAKIIGHL